MAITATHIADYQLPNLGQLIAGERYDTLSDIISTADTDKVFPNVSSKDNLESFAHESKICILRTRLFLLGYLKRDNGSGQLDNKLQRKLQQFQQDLNLTPTGILDNITWNALQEMVSFEHPINPKQWYQEDGNPYPAFLRAINLRLFVFGFLRNRQPRNIEKLDKALEKFTTITSLLRLDNGPFQSDVRNQQTIHALFDQDELLNCIGKAWDGQGFTLQIPEGMRKGKAERMVKNFIICFAKVELWLHGYNVGMDNKGTYNMPEGGVQPLDDNEYPLFSALVNFWEDSGQTETEAWEKAKSVNGAFFQKVSEMQEAGKNFQELHPSNRVYEILEQEDESVLKKVWDGIKTIGSRIWDGIKRIWYWFKAMLGKVVKTIKKVTAWATNLSRLAYQYALNAFPSVKLVIDSVSACVKTMVHPTYPESNPQTIVIRRDLDLDFKVYINPLAEKKAIEKIIQSFKRNTILVRFGFEIMGMLAATIIHVVRKIITAGGWFGLILALIKIFSRLKELRMVLNEEKILLAKVG